MSSKTYAVSLVVGDWSNDGHGRVHTMNVVSNQTAQQLQRCFASGSDKVGFNLTKEIACEYEDCRISRDKIDTLLKLGMSPEDLDEVLPEDNEAVFLGPEGFARIWIFVAKLGDSDLTCHEVATDRAYIGGYGLFHG